MDLQLYLRVLWRFRLLVALGLILASALALVSFVNVRLEGITPRLQYRTTEVWMGQTTLLVTQRGFPVGRSITDEGAAEPSAGTADQPRFADSDRYADLAALYARLATSDAVLRLMLRDGPIDGLVEADSVETSSRERLPLVEIRGFADTPIKSMRLSERGAEAFLEFLEREQDANRVPADERIVVSIVQRPIEAELFLGRKVTRPLMIFLAVVFAIVGLAFVLENLRPRMRIAAAEPVDGDRANPAA